MMYKGILANKSGLFQLWLLLCLILGGLFIVTIIILLTGIGTQPGTPVNNPGTLRFIQAFSVVFSFLFPALAMAWLCGTPSSDYLSIRKIPSAKLLLFVLAGLFLLNPTISLSNIVNKQLVLPPFMESVENWMMAKEQEMEDIVNLLINEKGVVAFISNMAVIALLAAVAEEFIFRGVGQRIIEKWTSNHHIVIWGAAFVFSAIHLQFYGFIPRLLLGAYFGYLLYWSKNIWVPVFAHFINNATAVIAGGNETLNKNEFLSGEIKDEHLAGFIIAAVITLFLFFILNKKIRQEALENI